MTAMVSHRSNVLAGTVVGFSVSYDKQELLARGFGREHLRELILRLVRPLLRQGANIAYAGNWKPEASEGENLTYELLRHISAEQNDNDLDDPGSGVGRLFNHCAWPHYLSIQPQVEARWINCCRIVRVSQQDAGLTPDEELSDELALNPATDGAQAKTNADRLLFNSAVALSAMRACVARDVPLPPLGQKGQETAPAVSARVMLGGKQNDYSGFLPGLFEEALIAIERRIPLYIVGGFGGSAGLLARLLLDGGAERPAELGVDYQRANNPRLTRLLELASKYRVPDGVRTSYEALGALHEQVKQARAGLSATLNTGLSEPETRELLTSRDLARVVQLVRKGLRERMKMKSLPA